ncbi:DNA alkylation repair protein [Zhihengliuella salsuginis]|uniref:3-methyladenine DNA glycosylase AlkC n=1 Tax=Zhihengliuella salsuginis TaxID=578222 RepID=A0ABQ3GCF9_9MICC|nr:DNA alkylation repair protein [Zhihengliuella salsuginis]GHD00279.1 hypothetical protein GCM10008096_03370 [Zhihengliuella salsuginis]
MAAPLKDQLFNRDKVSLIAADLARASAAAGHAFDAATFTNECVARFGEQELKERMAWIATRLHAHLPSRGGEDPTAVAASVDILLAALPPELDPELSDGDFGDFIHQPFAQFVADHCRTAELLELGLDAMHHITRRSSAEYAIRFFLDDFPGPTLARLETWTRDPNYHVRRLCSEGTRPLLPWAPRLALDRATPLPLLETLAADPTRYVTRSVANHLNDIAKRDPDLVVSTLARWQDDVERGRRSIGDLDFITRHATRTLVKAGHAGALALLGYDAGAHLTLTEVSVPGLVALGGALDFSLTLETAGTDVPVVVDYAIWPADAALATATGLPRGRKVFKLTQAVVRAGAPLELSKRHALRASMTTRRATTGPHLIELLVNGRPRGRAEFTIADAARP